LVRKREERLFTLSILREGNWFALFPVGREGKHGAFFQFEKRGTFLILEESWIHPS